MEPSILIDAVSKIGLPAAACVVFLLMFNKQQAAMFDKFGELLDRAQEGQQRFADGIVAELGKLRETLENDRERFFKVLDRNSLWLERQANESVVQTHLQAQQNDKLSHLETVAVKAAEVAEKVVRNDG